MKGRETPTQHITATQSVELVWTHHRTHWTIWVRPYVCLVAGQPVGRSTQPLWGDLLPSANASKELLPELFEQHTPEKGTHLLGGHFEKIQQR